MRSEDEVRQSILSRKSVTRDDIVELILPFRTLAEAMAYLQDFLDQFDASVVGYHGDKEEGIRRVLSDLVGYKRWEDA